MNTYLSIYLFIYIYIFMSAYESTELPDQVCLWLLADIQFRGCGSQLWARKLDRLPLFSLVFVKGMSQYPVEQWKLPRLWWWLIAHAGEHDSSMLRELCSRCAKMWATSTNRGEKMYMPSAFNNCLSMLENYPMKRSADGLMLKTYALCNTTEQDVSEWARAWPNLGIVESTVRDAPVSVSIGLLTVNKSDWPEWCQSWWLEKKHKA